MSKGGKQEVVQSTQLDPETKAFLQQGRKAASGVWNMAAGGQRYIPGVNPMTQAGQGQLADQYKAYGGLGGQYGQLAENLGLGTGILQNAAQGNVSQFMNPYEQQVIGGVQSDFDRQRTMGMNAAADQATRAGAFGGSRSAVLQSNAMNDVNRNETQTLAGLRSQGFNDSYSRALGIGGTLANLGLGGLQGQAGALGAQNQISGQQMAAGDYNRQVQQAQNEELYRRKLEGLGVFAPFLNTGGQTTMAPTSSSPLMSGLGGAGTGFALGGPVGAGIGGAIGLLGGLF